MSKKFNATEASILKGLKQAVDYVGGKEKGAKKHKVLVKNIDVKEARNKLGLSQDKFAEAFGVSAATIRNWEQHRTKPQGSARVLLNVIYNNPEAVLDAITI